MIGSSAFRSLVTAAARFEPDALPTPTGGTQAAYVCKLLQDVVIGKPIVARLPTLQELISGPFDADKLDYAVRDPTFAGVPRIVDISRLVQMLSIVSMTESELPADVASSVTSGEERYHLIGIRWSGVGVLDELHLARSLLFAKVYKHKKVQAIEVMLALIIKGLRRFLSAYDLLDLLYTFMDDECLALDSKTFRAALSRRKISGKGIALVELGGVFELIRRIRDRELFVSALVIQSAYPGDPRKAEVTQTGGLRSFIIDVRNPEKAAALLLKVEAEVRGAASSIGFDIELDGGVVGANLGDYLAIARPMEPAGDSEISRAFVFPADGAPVRYRDSIFNAEGWSRAYGYSSGSEGYIFTVPELATLTFVVMERILVRDYGVVLPQSAYLLSKIDRSGIADVKAKLLGSEFYKGISMEVRPLPARLKRADISGRVLAVERKFRAFQDPVLGGEEPSAPLDSARILSWLRQFEEDDDIESALGALERFRVLDRSSAVAAIRAFVSANPAFRGATLCGFGSPKDSSSIVSYYARDVPKGLIGAVTSIQEAAANGVSGPVILFDDLCASGGQARDILGNWFDVKDLKGDLGEERLPFHETERRFLRTRPTAFVFIAAWDEGVSEVADAARRVGMDSVVFRHIGEKDIPFAFDEEGMQRRNAAQFKAKCERIDREILISLGTSNDKMKARVLGHGNRAMLLGSTFNIPAQVMACLRENGTVGGLPWHGLFSRRKKS